jgi:hypothetical protein
LAVKFRPILVRLGMSCSTVMRVRVCKGTGQAIDLHDEFHLVVPVDHGSAGIGALKVQTALASGPTTSCEWPSTSVCRAPGLELSHCYHWSGATISSTSSEEAP